MLNVIVIEKFLYLMINIGVCDFNIDDEHEKYLREHEDIEPDEDYEMNLYVSDRKKLWGLAGAKCSICKCDLFFKEEGNTNIGKECHISSHSPNHFRYDSSLTEDERDKRYDNAILLCGPHHDAIDNPRNTQYTIEKLHQIKEEHEEWVAKRLEEDTEESMEMEKRREELNQKIDELVKLKKQEIELLKEQTARKEHRMQTMRLKEAFRDVKLIESEGDDTCEYPQNPTWLKIPEVRRYLLIHGAWELWEKISPAKEHYEEVDKEVRKKLSQITKHHIETKLGFFVGWNCKGDMPSNFYYYDHWGGEDRNFWLIDAIISNCTFRVIPQETGMFLLQANSSKYSGLIAGSDTKGNIERLEEEIRMVMKYDEVVKLVKKVNDAKEAWEKADKKFKKKLAKIVRNLNFNAGGL